MALDTPRRFFFDKPERQDRPEKLEKTEHKMTEQSDQASTVQDYPRKKALVDDAASCTKDSILDKYGDVIGNEQKERISQEVMPEKYEIYNHRYFVETKLVGVPDEQRYHILGFHEIEGHGIALRDNDNQNELRHVTTHETMHSLSYQKRLYEQGNGRWGETEVLGYQRQKTCSGIREVTYQNAEIVTGSVERIRINDINMGLNEGMTELYTLREMLERGEEPGIAAYTQQVNWAIKLEMCVGKDTMAKAYFGGELDGLKRKVDKLGGAPGTWEQLSGTIDHYGRISTRTEIARQERRECEREVTNTLQQLYRKSREESHRFTTPMGGKL